MTEKTMKCITKQGFFIEMLRNVKKCLAVTIANF